MVAASAAVSVTSHAMNSAGVSPCSCAASAVPAAVSRSQNPTFAPCAWKARTSASPMPLAPPEMNTVRPASEG